MLLLIAWYGLRAFVFLAGVLLVFITIQSTIHTLIVPRAINTPLVNWYYVGMNKLFRIRLALARQNTYELRDRVLAMYAPVSLFVLPFVWLTLMLVAYTLIFWGLGYGDQLNKITARDKIANRNRVKRENDRFSL